MALEDGRQPGQLRRGNSRSRLHTARGWALFGAVSVAAALITPFGIDGLLLPFKLFHMSFSFAVLAEWQSPNFQHFEPLELWLMVLLFSAFSLGWRLPPIRVGILLVLLHMALEHARHAELLGFVAPLVLAPALGPQLKARLGDRRVFLSIAACPSSQSLRPHLVPCSPAQFCSP